MESELAPPLTLRTCTKPVLSRPFSLSTKVLMSCDRTLLSKTTISSPVPLGCEEALI
jgi:hypothetical protein